MMKISAAGALFGAVVGATARGLVVILNIGSPEFIFALPSAGIGALVGLIAGSFRPALLAGVIGAVLSGLIFEFFMFACASAIRWIDYEAAGKFLVDTVIYGIQMGLAGAIAGVCGSLFGRYYDKLKSDQRNHRESDNLPS